MLLHSTNILYVIATKNSQIAVSGNLAEARQQACKLAGEHPGIAYTVYEWINGQRWQDHPTRYAYRGFIVYDNTDDLMKTNDAIKAIRDAEWAALDSERGHANMQTAHNQLLNWK